MWKNDFQRHVFLHTWWVTINSSVANYYKQIKQTNKKDMEEKSHD